MTNVWPFAPRAQGGGWTEAERARLDELAGKLAAKAGPVEVAYGTSDEGEPWCVVTNANDEILVHVARIDGRFVIHDSATDILRVGDTLRSACERLLGPDWRNPREDVVVSLNQRQMQSVLAIAILADFAFEVVNARAETAPETVIFVAEVGPQASLATALAEAPPAPINEEPTPDSAPSPPDATPSTVEEAQTVAVREDLDHLQLNEGGGEKIESQASQDLSPEPAQSRAVEGKVEQGGDGDDYLQGGAGEDELTGGGGDDTAAGGGSNDRLIGGDDDDLLLGEDGDDVAYGNLGDDTVDGGDGDDWVRGGKGDDSVVGGAGDDLLSGDRGADTIAGGAGADTFNFIASGGEDRVVDFSATEGDRVHIEGGVYTVRQVGGDTVIAVDEENAIVLVNVQFSNQPAGWIVA